MNSDLRHLSSALRYAQILFLIALFAGTARSATVVHPGFSFEDTNAFEPFGLDRSYGIFTCRYQQVYDASRFAAVLPDGLTITQLVFVVDNVFPTGFDSVFPDVQIAFSVTRRGPNQLSTNFSDNLGTNTVMVFPRGPLKLRASPGPSLPASIILPVPFFYHPGEGNLLVDIQKFAQILRDPFGVYPGVFDAYDSESDSVSRVFAYDVNSLSGTADTLGLKTIFRGTPPPVPRLLFRVGVDNIATNLVMRWYRSSVVYTLQESVVLGAGASWRTADAQVYSDLEFMEAVVPLNPPRGDRYYRLFSPPSTNAAAIEFTNEQLPLPHSAP